jgi:hypothetical protein
MWLDMRRDTAREYNPMTGKNGLQPIPVIDVRTGGPVRHARLSAAGALALRNDCVAWLPLGSLVPLLDGLTRRWLKRSQSPYVAEIETIAASLGISGVWLLNGSYQWGCTTLAREQENVPWLARTLDWPFPGLGRHVEIAQMAGPAGAFYQATWPGYVGALTAMAPGRFAACINQAPLFRRTRHRYLRLYDIAANAVGTWWRIGHIPPDQLLRQVFETCADFATARRALETTPIARPVIYTLVGVRQGERCVIERTEDGFGTRETATSAANDWHERRDRWEARVGGDMLINCEMDEAAANSRGRRAAIDGFQGTFGTGEFDWVREPVLNRFTRIAVEMCPANAVLRVAGYETDDGAAVARRVTETGAVDSKVKAA